MLQFIVLDINSPYNAFLDRAALTEFSAAISPWCLTFKLPLTTGSKFFKKIRRPDASVILLSCGKRSEKRRAMT